MNYVTGIPIDVLYARNIEDNPRNRFIMIYNYLDNILHEKYLSVTLEINFALEYN
jgi:hypothetical protein